MKIQGKTAHAVGAFACGSSDNWNFNSGNPCLHFGGNYNQSGNHGLFYVNYNGVSNANANIGCRVLFGLAITSIPRRRKLRSVRPGPWAWAYFLRCSSSSQQTRFAGICWDGERRGRGLPRHPLVQISHQDTV